MSTTMAKRKKPGSQETKQFSIRMPLRLLAALERLAAENLTDISSEIVAASLDRVKAKGHWPPPDKPHSKSS